MEAVIFIGLPAAGKSSFYVQRFLHTHVRINMDMLKTRNRERTLMQACLDTKQPFVMDKVNAAMSDRLPYIQAARAAGFQVIGYYFQAKVKDCLGRNAARREEERIPEVGILGTYKRLEIPKLDEGFDKLFYVRIDGPEFVVEEWKDEV